MNDLTLGWVAGLLEGEGCFHLQQGRFPRITLQMADEDVVRRVHQATGVGAVNGPYWPSGRDHKPCWRWQVGKPAEVRVVLTAIRPLMGERRAAKIDQCLAVKERVRTKTHCPKNHPYDEENTYLSATGGKRCRACALAREKRRTAERRALRSA